MAGHSRPKDGVASARLCPGHPRLTSDAQPKTWMPGSSPGMTAEFVSPYHFPKRTSAISRRDASEVYVPTSHPQFRGRRECRALDAPAASYASDKKHTSVVTTVTPVSPGIPRAMVYGFLRALPGVPSLLATVDTGTGCQDHTTSPSASVPFVIGTSASIASRPNVRDDRETPLKWEQDRNRYELIC
jgi:hypothetical protein